MISYSSEENFEEENDLSDTYIEETLSELEGQMDQFDFFPKEGEQNLSFPTTDGFFDIEDLQSDFENIHARNAWHYYSKNKLEIEEIKNQLI